MREDDNEESFVGEWFGLEPLSTILGNVHVVGRENKVSPSLMKLDRHIFASTSTDSTAMEKFSNTDLVVRLRSIVNSNRLKDFKLNLFLSEVAGSFIWCTFCYDTAEMTSFQEKTRL